MKSKELSHKYFQACQRVADVSEKLYEDLHTRSGDPVTDEALIRKMITDTIKEIRTEFELIKSAIVELKETNHE